MTTAYFVEPEVICSTGRTQSEFDVEGTGNCLLFQNGPSTHDLIKVPLDLDSADGSVSIFILFHDCILKLFFSAPKCMAMAVGAGSLARLLG